MQAHTIQDPDTRDMARKAFDIYDTQGEGAMLDFILRNERQDQAQDDLEAGCYRLEDGTVIQHTGQDHPLYEALYGSNNLQTRPAATSLEHQPPYLNLRAPIFPTPTHASIIKKILQEAESLAREETGLIHDGDLITIQDAIRTMPGLQNALLNATAVQDRKPIPEDVRRYLHKAVADCAHDAVAFLDPAQYQDLFNTAKQRLERDGRTDAQDAD